MIIANNITKTYGKHQEVLAVDDVSLSIEKGELFGLIGPDGAGKSSLFRMLTTLLLPDKGEAKINNLDLIKDYKKIRNIVGYMPGKFSLYPDLTIEENLNFFATLFNTTVKENYDLIKDIYVQIEKFKDRRAGKLSGGMKQKLALCCALIHKPVVLFLDEPTTGVDPVSRKEFWEMLKSLKVQGITIMVSTPYMDEAVLCDRIALIQKGKILSIETPEKVMQSYPYDLFAVKTNDMHKLLRQIGDFNKLVSGYAFGEYAHFSFKRETVTEIDIKSQLTQQGFEGIEVHRIKANVEDCFINLLKN